MPLPQPSTMLKFSPMNKRSKAEGGGDAATNKRKVLPSAAATTASGVQIIRKEGNNKRPKHSLSKELPVPDQASMVGNVNLLRTLFPGSLPTKAGAAALATASGSNLKAAATNAKALSTVERATALALPAASSSPLAAGGDKDDPPGFDQFKVDPEFCQLIVESAHHSKNKMEAKRTRNMGGLFVNGLLNSEYWCIMLIVVV